MGVVRRDLDQIVAGAELLASLVEDNTVLIEMLSLSDYWEVGSWVLSGHASWELTGARRAI